MFENRKRVKSQGSNTLVMEEFLCHYLQRQEEISVRWSEKEGNNSNVSHLRNDQDITMIKWIRHRANWTCSSEWGIKDKDRRFRMIFIGSVILFWVSLGNEHERGEWNSLDVSVLEEFEID